jgi:hypothetical protein
MQAIVWLCMVQFRVMQFGMVWFGASYANLRPHIFKRQISGKNLILQTSK